MLEKISKPMNKIQYKHTFDYHILSSERFITKNTWSSYTFVPNKLNSKYYKTQSKICKRVSFQIILSVNDIKTHQIRNISTQTQHRFVSHLHVYLRK